MMRITVTFKPDVYETWEHASDEFIADEIRQIVEAHPDVVSAWLSSATWTIDRDTPDDRQFEMDLRK